MTAFFFIKLYIERKRLEYFLLKNKKKKNKNKILDKK